MSYNPRNQPPSQRMTTEQIRIAALLAPTDGSSYQFDSYLPEELESYHLAVMDFFRTYCQLLSFSKSVKLASAATRGR